MWTKNADGIRIVPFYVVLVVRGATLGVSIMWLCGVMKNWVSRVKTVKFAEISIDLADRCISRYFKSLRFIFPALFFINLNEPIRLKRKCVLPCSLAQCVCYRFVVYWWSVNHWFSLTWLAKAAATSTTQWVRFAEGAANGCMLHTLINLAQCQKGTTRSHFCQMELSMISHAFCIILPRRRGNWLSALCATQLSCGLVLPLSWRILCVSLC